MILMAALICTTIILMGVIVLIGVEKIISSKERQLRDLMTFEERLVDKLIEAWKELFND